LDNLFRYQGLLYGREKSGKTSLLAQFPEAFFMMGEPGGKALRIYQRPCTTWSDVLGYTQLLEDTPGKFQTVVMDLVDQIYERCLEHVCRQQGIDHPSDIEDYGKTWSRIRTEFTRVVNRLANTGRGVWFVSHAVEREIQPRGSNSKYTIITPTMSGQCRRVVEGLVDIIGYLRIDQDGQRVLQIRGDNVVTAGHRLQEHFVGRADIPLGTDAAEGYRNFLDAFDNKTTSQKPVAKSAKFGLKK
jgi:hypothetical protein